MYNKSNVIVNGGSSTYVAGDYNINTDGSRKGFERLEKHVAAGALHNSGEVSDQPKCHPGTRVAILEHLVAWATALTYMYPVIWLHGPAGAGKSAILRTIAQILFDRGFLLGSFFFFRSATGRNVADDFIGTIAYQLTLSIPATRVHIEKAIETNPLIFSLSLWDQALNLIVSPILAARAEDPHFDSNPVPRIIIVDGLDECRNPDKQIEILQVLTRTLQNLPIPFAVLVASRPEHHIRDAFDLGDLNKYSSRLCLDNSHNPDADIKKYLIENFNSIKENPRLNPYISTSFPWPSEEVLNKLVAKASGQFIFASTVVKFVSSTRHNPAKRLDIILGTLDAGNLKPFEQLDMLYSTIFLTIDPLDLASTLHVIGVLLVPYSTNAFEGGRTPALIEQLLELEKGEIRQLLFDLESLLTVGRDDESICFFHASLSDYLFDKSRSGQFWIDAGLVYADIAKHCISHVPYPNQPAMRSFFMDNISHFFSKATPILGLRQAVENFDMTKMMGPAQKPNRAQRWLGARDLCPTLLEAAIHHSTFSNPKQLFGAQFRAYLRIIEPRIQVYFQNTHLKHFLITVVTKWLSDPHQARVLVRELFKLSQELVNADHYNGLNIIQLFEYSDRFPSIFSIFQTLFDDPSGRFFIDGNQYADTTLYILELGYESPWLRLKPSCREILPTVLQPLFSKSSIRLDLVRAAKRVTFKATRLTDLTSTQLPPYFQELHDIIDIYISRSKLEAGVGGYTELSFGQVETSLSPSIAPLKQIIPTTSADRPNTKINESQLEKKTITPATSSRSQGRDPIPRANTSSTQLKKTSTTPNRPQGRDKSSKDLRQQIDDASPTRVNSSASETVTTTNKKKPVASKFIPKPAWR